MYIIFGNESAQDVEEKYIVLELDTMRLAGNSEAVTAYCVLERDNIPLTEISQIPNYVNLHTKLMENYRKRNWDFCEQALEHLRSRWRGEVDSFYIEIGKRIAKYKEQDPGPEWDGIYEKTFVDTKQ